MAIIGGSGQKPPTQLFVGNRFMTGSVSNNRNLSSSVYLVYSANANVFQTMVDVTGSGVWSFGAFGTTATSTNARVKVTLDGVIVYNVEYNLQTLNTQIDLSALQLAQVGGGQSNLNNYATMQPGNVVFNESLKIEVSAGRYASFNNYSVAGAYIILYYLT